MDVDIGEVSSTVRTVDGESLLDPRTARRIVQLVLEALDDRQLHQQRDNVRRKVTRSVLPTYVDKD
jgi:hypothetical protein